MRRFVDRASMSVASAPGTGAYPLGAAIANRQTFAAAGMQNGDTTDAYVDDGANWQCGQATYSTTGPTLTFSKITDSSNGGAAINATANAIVTGCVLGASLQDLPTPGEIVMAAGNTPTPGTVAANGALLSRAAYAALWAYAQASGNLAASDGAWASGQFSPGDGSTTFRIPDGRGVFLRGWDNGRGLDPGRTIGSYHADTYASHTHGVSDPAHAHGVYDPSHHHGAVGGGGSSGGYGGINLLAPSTGYNTTYSATGISINSAATGISINAAGSTETAPKNISVLVCIRY